MALITLLFTEIISMLQWIVVHTMHDYSLASFATRSFSYSNHERRVKRPVHPSQVYQNCDHKHYNYSEVSVCIRWVTAKYIFSSSTVLSLLSVTLMYMKRPKLAAAFTMVAYTQWPRVQSVLRISWASCTPFAAAWWIRRWDSLHTCTQTIHVSSLVSIFPWTNSTVGQCRRI